MSKTTRFSQDPNLELNSVIRLVDDNYYKEFDAVEIDIDLPITTHPTSPNFCRRLLSRSARRIVGAGLWPFRWYNRLLTNARTRDHLCNLDDHLLRDIGISAWEARNFDGVPKKETFFRPPL